MTIVLCCSKMFTRVPTFIPTSPKNADEFVNTRYNRSPSQANKASKAKTKIHHQDLLSRKRKKSKTSSRRRKKTEESSYDCQLPVIVCEGQDATTVQDSNNVSHLYPTSRHTAVTDQWSTRITEESEGMAGIDTDQDILTLQPRLHKRHRQKGTEEVSPHQGDNETRTSRNELRLRDKIKTDGETRVDIWGSGRLSRSHITTSRGFRSKIPVRFPMIQEKANTNSKGHSGGGRSTIPSLPPIQSEPSTGVVTRSILDYQNKLENDFKRLGENLDNTFKLLHRYIHEGRSTDDF